MQRVKERRVGMQRVKERRAGMQRVKERRVGMQRVKEGQRVNERGGLASGEQCVQCCGTACGCRVCRLCELVH